MLSINVLGLLAFAVAASASESSWTSTCIMQDVRCVEESGVLNLQLRAICRAYLYKSKFSSDGGCKQKGFICPKPTPSDNWLLKGLTILDKPDKDGKCTPSSIETSAHLAPTSKASDVAAPAGIFPWRNRCIFNDEKCVEESGMLSLKLRAVCRASLYKAEFQDGGCIRTPYTCPVATPQDNWLLKGMTSYMKPDKDGKCGPAPKPVQVSKEATETLLV